MMIVMKPTATEEQVAAVIARMRHRATEYDWMAMPLVGGQRREVRRLLAGACVARLDADRAGRDGDAMACPLRQAWRGRTAPAAQVLA